MSTYDPNDVVRYDVPSSSDEIAAFWTEERMKAAKPVSSLRGREVKEPGDDQKGGQPSYPPATLAVVNNVGSPPYSTVGKLFFDLNGESYIGTAFIVGASTIATVGHNVGALFEDAFMWSEKMSFYPQNNAGPIPLGAYAMRSYLTLEGWVAEEDYTYDLALCLTTRPFPLELTGWLEPLVKGKLPFGYPVKAIGYPGAAQFNNQMYESQGQLTFSDPSQYMTATNRLSGGASGGPWVVLDADKHPWANGVNSMQNDDGETWNSPYFGIGMQNLLKYVNNLPSE